MKLAPKMFVWKGKYQPGWKKFSRGGKNVSRAGKRAAVVEKVLPVWITAFIFTKFTVLSN